MRGEEVAGDGRHLRWQRRRRVTGTRGEEMKRWKEEWERQTVGFRFWKREEEDDWLRLKVHPTNPRQRALEGEEEGCVEKGKKRKWRGQV